MRNGYVAMIGGTLLIAAVLAGLGTLVLPRQPVSPVSAEDAATGASGSASEQAASLEAAELEARENPPPPSTSGIVAAPPAQTQPESAAPSGYQGSAPMPTIQFAGSPVDTSETPPAEPATEEE